MRCEESVLWAENSRGRKNTTQVNGRGSMRGKKDKKREQLVFKEKHKKTFPKRERGGETVRQKERNCKITLVWLIQLQAQNAL